ncbi:uncharacterized protein PHACADRAFT_264139 [Phanerochaete carnosa HHB-10118-sp]|uniref:Uncharacterized protein n=1 Tax=Phanerochaete carnosa (strain HHB-10118-sp) TaxID=650164 RepID=K5ULY1_PHACS|nr:uncharacterized protein PHACADRAFT_264139 [Phanerochaete carnosa HHB-10118-sp]EKM50706.1 hypothetical protein PHACADRAFT_264139 [Phanerochaete carnosa HHB-10118-sp]
MSANDPPNTEGTQSSNPQQTDPVLDWEGDKMFNIYIHDYCEKRGYMKTADALREEAGVEKDGGPPINARQGLLFEWWSVFWVLFGAKSSGQGTDDALLYTQYQTQMAAQRQNEQQQQGSRPPPQARPPGQPPMSQRPVNGIPRPPGPGASAMLNGVPPANAMPGQPPQMANGIPNAYPGAIPPPNGVSGPGALPPNGQPTGAPAHQPMVPGQRPPMASQRPPNGQPFRSPTMAPSPQNPGMPQPGQQPNPMSGPSGPQPMNRGPAPMGPPNGQPNMHGGPMAGGPQMALPHFPQHGTPSQPNSPAAAQGITAQSPLLANRQIRPQDPMRQLQETTINQDLLKIESARLPELKHEAGLANKDLPSLTMDDKQRIVGLARARGLLPKVSGPVPPNAIPGPSNPQPQMQPNQRGPIAQSPLTAHGQINRAMKRNSTSPDENGEQSQSNDSSPPANKRLRKSPDQPPMMPMGGMPGQPPHGPPSGTMPRHGMVPFAGMPNNQPAMNMPGGHTGTPHMGNAMLGHQPHMMTPQMAQHSPQYRQTMHALHKNNINNIPQGPFNLAPSANASSPATSAESPYNNNPDQQQQPRPGANQYVMPGIPPNRQPVPGQKHMMMPPSPGIAGKNVGGAPQGPGGPGDKPGDGNGMNRSPRNAAPAPGQQGQPGHPGQQPGQSGQLGQPGGPPGQQPPQQPGPGPMNPPAGANTAPQTPSGGNAPGPNMLNANAAPAGPGPQSAPPQMQATPDMFGADLMSANFEFGGLDTTMFGQNDLGSMDFASDFSEWFNDPSIISADKM